MTSSAQLPDQPMPLSRWAARRRQQLSARLFVLHERSRKVTDHLQLDGVDSNEATLAGTSGLLKRLLSAEKQMRQMLVDHPAAILVVDEDGLVQLSNNAARDLLVSLGIEQGSLYLGKPVSKVLPGVMTDSQVQYRTLPGQHDQEQVSLVVKRANVVWGQRAATLVMLHDVTPQVQAREELERALVRQGEINQMKSEFISMASHEFRTPLTSVLSSVELMEEYIRRSSDDLGDQFVSRMRRHLDRSREALTHLDNMVAEMLVLEKSHGGQVDCLPQDFDLVVLVNDVLDSLQSVSEQFQITLRRASEPSLPVRLDPRLVRHILTNLVSNAVRFSSQESEVVITLAVDDQRVNITVADQGIGIPEADHPRMFEPFFRGQNGQHTEGTGLGLAIVKRFVDLHSGHIEFDSTPGRGTTFRLVLPSAGAAAGDHGNE